MSRSTSGSRNGASSAQKSAELLLGAVAARIVLHPEEADFWREQVTPKLQCQCVQKSQPGTACLVHQQEPR